MATVLKSESNWYSVPAYQVENPAVWRPIEAILDRTCDEYRANDVRRAVAAGEMQLWVAANGSDIMSVLLTQIVNRKRGRSCVVLFVGGSGMAEWIAERWRVCDWAREMGCQRVEFQGRKGWARFFPEANEKGVMLEIAL